MADIEDSGSSAVPLQSAEDVLSSLFSKGSYASVSHRTQLFNENFPLLLSLDVTPELVDDIAIAFTSTAGTYVDKKSRKLVDGALLAVLRSPLKTAVVEKLVAIFQRLSNALARKKSLQHPPYVLSFLRWSCLILKNYDLDAVKAVLNQIISFHAAVFETLSESSSNKFWATATHYLTSALRKVL